SPRAWGQAGPADRIPPGPKVSAAAEEERRAPRPAAIDGGCTARTGRFSRGKPDLGPRIRHPPGFRPVALHRLVLRNRPTPFRIEPRRQPPLSRRETLAEGDQQSGRPLDADFPAQQGPQQASLFRQEPKPRLAVGGHSEVGLALMTVPDLQDTVPDRDGRLLRLLAGEGEVVDGVQLRCLPGLERERKTRQEALDRAGPQAVADSFDRLEGETTGHMLLGFRAGDDV